MEKVEMLNKMTLHNLHTIVGLLFGIVGLLILIVFILLNKKEL